MTQVRDITWARNFNKRKCSLDQMQVRETPGINPESGMQVTSQTRRELLDWQVREEQRKWPVTGKWLKGFAE